MVQNLKWATAHLSRRLGHWVRRASGRWVLGAERAGAGRGAQGAGRPASGTAWARGALARARQGERAWAPATCGARGGARGVRGRARRAGERGKRRQGRAGRPAGRPVRVWCAQLGQVGCFGAPDSVFGLV